MVQIIDVFKIDVLDGSCVSIDTCWSRAAVASFWQATS
jgi:hypothetical protein